MMIKSTGQIRLRTPLLGLCSLLLLSACGEESAPNEPRLRPVRFVQAQAGGDERARVFSGTSKSARESRMSFKVAGNIRQLPVKVGDALSSGDLIAALDDSPYRLQAQQSQASLVQAEANERGALANYERVKGLYENNNASRNDLDSARASAESASAQTRAAAKAVELARLNLDYTRLQSTSDCSVASINVELSENVASGTTVAMLNCGHEIEVEITVPESLIAGVREGMTAEISFAAIGNARLSGVVSEVGVSAVGGATFPVTVNVTDSHTDLRSGLAAEVRVSASEDGGDAVITVPSVAVGEDESGRYVYVLEPAGEAGVATVRRRGVSIGELTEAGIQIVDGLTVGEPVVTAGVSVIRDGLRVRAELP